MDGIQPTVNRFAGMADGLSNYSGNLNNDQAVNHVRESDINAAPHASQAAVSTRGKTVMQNGEMIATFRSEMSRLEKANKEIARQMSAMQQRHAKQLVEFVQKNEAEEAIRAQKFDELMDALGGTEITPEILSEIEGIGDDPFTDIKKLEKILIALGKDNPQAAYLLLQLNVNRAAGAIELSTKIVEHGTSGIKTLLQTQT